MIVFVIAHWRIFALGAGVLLVGWWIKASNAAAYRKGATERETSMLQDEAARLEAANAVARKALDERAAELDAQEAAIASERSALSTQRKSINAALTSGLNSISARETEVRNATMSTADGDLLPAIRSALDAIRTAESTRPAR